MNFLLAIMKSLGLSILLLTILFTVNTKYSYSQSEIWTLEGCIEYAMKNNINVKSNEINVEMSELNLEQAKYSYSPNISANGGYNLNTGRALDPTTYQFISGSIVNNVSANVGASTPIFQGFQKYHNLQKSHKDLLAQREDFQRFKNDMSLTIARYYLEILYNQELIISMEQQMASSENNIERMKKLVDAGSATKGQLLDLEAQYSNEVYSTIDARNRLEISVINLCQILEIKDFKNFKVSTPSIESLIGLFPSEDVDQIAEMARTMPEIQGAIYKKESAEHNVKLMRSRLYPSLSFNFNYGSSYSDTRKRPILGANGLPLVNDGGIVYEKYPFGGQFRDNAGTSSSISLSIPIFNGLTTRRNVASAKLAYRQAEYAVRDSEIKLYQQIQQAYSDATGALKKFEAALARVTANEESIKYMEQKFTVGSATITDYNMAKNNIMIAESQMLQAKFDYIFKVKILEFYKGVPITLE